MTNEDAWLAGLIEGEGCIDIKRASGVGKSDRLRMRVSMTDEDVVARVATVWGAGYRERKVGAGEKRQWTTEVSGRRAVDVAARIRPLLGARRGARVDAILAEVPTLRSRP